MKVSSTSERLKILMNERSLRQIDILNLCEPFCKKYNVKMGRNDISQYINGKVEPRQDKISILSKALNVDEAWLMGFDVPINDKERYILEQEKTNRQLTIDDVFRQLGWEPFHILDFYNNCPVEGRNELMNYIEYLISKYDLQGNIETEKEANSKIFAEYYF